MLKKSCLASPSPRLLFLSSPFSDLSSSSTLIPPFLRDEGEFAFPSKSSSKYYASLVLCVILTRFQALRRSLKGEKDPNPKHHHISITPKSAIAILPPKKVSLMIPTQPPNHPEYCTYALYALHTFALPSFLPWPLGCFPPPFPFCVPHSWQKKKS